MSKTTTSTQQSSPWAPAQPALKQALGDATNIYNSGGFTTNPYQGQRVADFSQQTQSALGQMANAPQMLNNYTAQDPYRGMDQIRQNVTDQTKQALAGTFAGAMDSGLAQQGYARGIGSALANVEYGNYNRNQDRQLTALGMVPQFSAMALQGGQTADAHQQSILDANRQKYYQGQNAIPAGLERYSAFARGMGGMGGKGSASQTTPWSLGNFGQAVGALGAIF